ncbi:hypothetical protein [Pseudoalteromonas rubra]|uniref:Uncharacterized protein n=1 Tax=Pseudoalteromonas rubra TaxID=43658 RepID=A0A0U3GAY6_9GAMM|nr:hypothetical protein [Pseudoalteromonas rubra]ALU41914.1 hypothetical protein AT705_02605 [Pseudoalteromonas rubra]
METFVILLWKDARVATNEVYGVVEVDQHDIARLIAEKYTQLTGNKVQHCELRGVVSDTSEMYANLPRLDIGQEDL